MKPDKLSMSPYERCMATIEGLIADRVPSYTPSIACDVASKILGREAHTGSPTLWYAAAKAWLAGKNAYEDFQRKHEEDIIELNRTLDIEVIRYPWLVSIRPTVQLDEYTFLSGDPDGIHQVWHWDEEIMNFHKVKDTKPKRRPEDWPEMAKQRLKSVDASARRVRESTGIREAKLQRRLGDEMMVVAGGGSLSLGLDEASLMACAVEPGAVGDILDCQLEVALAQMEGMVERGIKVVLGGGDMADKNGPIYSPRMFRDLILPRLKKLAVRCRELELHYVWRTDGNLWSIGDMLFDEAGVPGYGEVDRDASMEVGRIRDKYPNVVVWANASGDALFRRSRAEVYDYCMTILKESEGRCYFHGVSNTILPGTRPENVWAMMEARDDFSRHSSSGNGL
jgi:hypothetical protein